MHGGLLEPLVAIVISFDIIWMSNNPKKHTIQQSTCYLFTAWYYSAKGQGLIDTQQCRADIPYYQQRVDIYFNNITPWNFFHAIYVIMLLMYIAQTMVVLFCFVYYYYYSPPPKHPLSENIFDKSFFSSWWKIIHRIFFTWIYSKT